MKKIGIVTDSNSSISQAQAKSMGIRVLPMPFYMGEECFYEDVTLSREEFFEKLDSGIKVTTSQPAPTDVMKLWDEALAEYDEILYFPMSSGLSGSCQTAMMLADDKPYEGKVFVVDNGRISTPQHRSILDALEMIEEGYSAAEIKKMLEAAKADMVIYIGVETLENLKNGGRITPSVAAIGTLLNIKPILKLDTGSLDSFKKCRGFSKARAGMIEAMRHDLETTFKDAYDKKEIYLLAASSASDEVTKDWIAQIQEAFPDMEVMCDDLSLSVSCHTGYGALGIGCSCRPKRI